MQSTTHNTQFYANHVNNTPWVTSPHQWINPSHEIVSQWRRLHCILIITKVL